jgi:hypothetical protein
MERRLVPRAEDVQDEKLVRRVLDRVVERQRVGLDDRSREATAGQRCAEH